MGRARALGHVEVSGPSGTTVYETFTCCHCNEIHRVPPANAKEMAFCHKCGARECVPCAKKLGGRCTPFEKRIEAMEARGRMLAAIGA